MFFERPESAKKIPTDSEKKKRVRRSRKKENSISNKNQKEITFFFGTDNEKKVDESKPNTPKRKLEEDVFQVGTPSTQKRKLRGDYL